MAETKEDQVTILWVRWGDNADYEETTLDRVREQVAFLQESGPTEIAEGGFTAPGFQGNNYISLYWGDKEGGWHRDLRYLELIVAGLL